MFTIASAAGFSVRGHSIVAETYNLWANARACRKSRSCS